MGQPGRPVKIHPRENLRGETRVAGYSLAYLHEMGIVHHDIKLDNFLVHKKDKNQEIEVYVGDLGLASLEADAEPPIWVNVAQAPPDFFMKSDSNWSSPSYDSWMYGLMLVEIFDPEAKVPWQEELDKDDDNSVLQKMTTDWIDHLKIPQDIKKIIKSLMNPNPEERITPRDAAEELWKADNPDFSQNLE